jgi:hypothetical protein
MRRATHWQAVREGLATQRPPPYTPADPQDIMAALMKTHPPPEDLGKPKKARKRKAAKKR